MLAHELFINYCSILLTALVPEQLLGLSWADNLGQLAQNSEAMTEIR